MNARERRLAVITAAVLGVGGGWGLVLEPAWARWSQADAEARSLERALEAERSVAQELDALRAERLALDERLRPEASAGPDGVVPAFLAHVRALGKESGFEPSTLRFLGARPLVEADAQKRRGAAKDEKPPFAELTFELRARTTLAKLTDFLVRLASEDRPVRVASLGITPRTGGGSELDVDLGLVALAPAEVLEGTR